MTPILTSSSLTTTLMSVNLAIIVFIIVLLCGVAGFTMWAVQRRKPWSPFDKNGYVDLARLKREGFHEIGTIREDDLGVQLREEANERINRLQQQIVDLKQLRAESRQILDDPNTHWEKP